MIETHFQLPFAVDLLAIFLGAITGVFAAMRRGYDLVGVLALAFVTGLGGALLRDGLFIQTGPPAFLADGRFIMCVVAATLVGAMCHRYIVRINRVIALLDAFSLGAYAVVGMTKASNAGLSVPAVILIGMVNACGGGFLRDIIVRTEPLVFKPGQFYVLATAAGCILHVFMLFWLRWPIEVAAFLSITATFTIRVLTIAFNWHTQPFLPSGPLPPEPPDPPGSPTN